MLAGAAAPLAELAGAIEPIALLSVRAASLAGFLLYAIGLAGTFASQLYMGSSWRIGVDTAERTALVTSGPFAVVRNPIYTALLAGWLGIVLIDPNLIQLAALLTSLVGLELQTRLVEEPYLLRTHGDAYRSYARRVGRFVPALGRLP
jgi:protein-S-isoprenylcysteine O-methyltransferase Ste14